MSGYRRSEPVEVLPARPGPDNIVTASAQGLQRTHSILGCKGAGDAAASACYGHQAHCDAPGSGGKQPVAIRGG